MINSYNVTVSLADPTAVVNISVRASELKVAVNRGLEWALGHRIMRGKGLKKVNIEVVWRGHVRPTWEVEEKIDGEWRSLFERCGRCHSEHEAQKVADALIVEAEKSGDAYGYEKYRVRKREQVVSL